MEKIAVYRSARATERSILHDVVPLSTPYQLVLDSTNACNFKCEFCPTGDKTLLKAHSRPLGNMSYDLFTKIVDDCKGFPQKIKRLDFGKDGEPLLHKKFEGMVSYAKNSDVFEHISVATNASLLTNERALRIVDAGMDLIKISVEAVSDDGYRRIAKVNFDYQELIDRVAFLYSNRKKCKVYAKIIDYGLTQAEKDKFYEDFNRFSDFITIDTVSGWSVLSAKDFTLGSNPSKYLDLPAFNKKEVCPVSFYSLSINFNGEVSICCVDWTMSTVVGDLRRESLPNLWNGERLYNFRKMHLTGNRSLNKACGDCFAINGWIDNIDAQADEILHRLTSQQESLKSPSSV